MCLQEGADHLQPGPGQPVAGWGVVRVGFGRLPVGDPGLNVVKITEAGLYMVEPDVHASEQHVSGVAPRLELSLVDLLPVLGPNSVQEHLAEHPDVGVCLPRSRGVKIDGAGGPFGADHCLVSLVDFLDHLRLTHIEVQVVRSRSNKSVELLVEGLLHCRGHRLHNRENHLLGVHCEHLPRLVDLPFEHVAVDILEQLVANIVEAALGKHQKDLATVAHVIKTQIPHKGPTRSCIDDEGPRGHEPDMEQHELGILIRQKPVMAGDNHHTQSQANGSTQTTPGHDQAIAKGYRATQEVQHRLKD
mmetsp:Transcript_23786/g.53986  ORF Transcript_23786/g.53986 Transcript_23786/m.53986 type:complete len:303 (-) Transcript_23786:2588-3496(-)